MGTVVTMETRMTTEIMEQKTFEDFNEAIDKVKRIQELRKRNGEWNKDLVKSVNVFFHTYIVLENIFPVHYHSTQNYQRESGQSLSKSRSISVVCKVVMEGLKMGYRDKAGKLDTHQFTVISKSLRTLMNYSDCTPEVTYDIAGEPNFLETMKEILTQVLPDHLQDKAKFFVNICSYLLSLYFPAVCRLARNDENKSLLVEMGCLPHLVKLAKSGNVDEQRETVIAISLMSFHLENLKKIVHNTRLIDVLIELKEHSTDKEVRKAVDIIFWNLRVELQNNNNYNYITMKSEESHGAPVKDRKVHILISYEQSNQEMLIKIRDILKADGYVVCMNNDNTLEVMAKAVEEAHVILLCISRKYKHDLSCKAEAEYAFSLKKKIIPLKMERGYTPDGWLGFLLGAKFIFDFSGNYPFEGMIIQLQNEIANFYRHDV
ncbi:hypothetical protein ACJMK2_004577 [Sinanodonta woodiana]|uniref:TIR domain-containing protein n=1 Tax=Sinanodonta woodiana TaxID=1069815 RepID=A0ABD3Y2S8_SINWO